jgi:hypothetical protein
MLGMAGLGWGSCFPTLNARNAFRMGHAFFVLSGGKATADPSAALGMTMLLWEGAEAQSDL